MIVDKKNNKVVSGNKDSVFAQPEINESPTYEVQEQVAANGPIDVLKAMIEILQSVTWEYGNPKSPKIFRTVQVDDGQYERIISPSGNKEETLGFPAAFVHFINWHYLVQASRINEGRAELRIRFILNNIDTHSGGHQYDIYYVAERIIQTIQEKYHSYECLQERCQLEYVDPAESFDKSLQPCWLTYEIWFRQTNIWFSRNRTLKNFVCPPFTNHADQDTSIEGVNPEEHNNLEHPTTYDEATKYINNGRLNS